MRTQERVGSAIRSTRRIQGLSLRGLADRVGLDFGYLGRIERGAPASVDVYERLAVALNLSLAGLFSHPGEVGAVAAARKSPLVARRASRAPRQPSNRSR